MLIQLVDETSNDFYENCHLPKKGDVLRVHDFSRSWGEFFTSNPHWGIWTFDITREDAALYMNPEMDITPFQPSSTLQFRTRYLEVDDLQPGMKYEQLKALTRLRDPIPDIHILGGN